MANSDWRDLEHLVANIQRGLAPEASVEHNVKVMGKDSEIERQIDIYVKQQIGQYTMTIAIDCKDYKRPVDVKGVEEFAGMVQDIRANKGVLVCPAGFTSSAKKLAKKKEIELYRPVDNNDHKWRVKATMPAVCEYISAGMSFKISCSYPGPFKLEKHPADLDALSVEGQRLGTALDVAMEKWNNGEYPPQPGQHDDLAIFRDVEVQVDNGYGGLAPVQLTVTLFVQVERYFGQIAIDRISGFLDEQTGLTITNSFVTGAIDPVEIRNQWQKLDDKAEAPIKPVLSIRGLIGWDLDKKLPANAKKK
ncbi:MAG: restriction endonuclease [Collimonas pratensis]|uniref:restriction endonuclease n=1 Tax=Collimonas pratensis TaxID=279113 RepID=UPI003C720227